MSGNITFIGMDGSVSQVVDLFAMKHAADIKMFYTQLPVY